MEYNNKTIGKIYGFDEIAGGSVKDKSTLDEIKSGLEAQDEMKVKNCTIKKGTN